MLPNNASPHRRCAVSSANGICGSPTANQSPKRAISTAKGSRSTPYKQERTIQRRILTRSPCPTDVIGSARSPCPTDVIRSARSPAPTDVIDSARSPAPTDAKSSDGWALCASHSFGQAAPRSQEADWIAEAMQSNAANKKTPAPIAGSQTFTEKAFARSLCLGSSCAQARCTVNSARRGSV